MNKNQTQKTKETKKLRETVDYSKIAFTDDFMFCTVMEDLTLCKEFLERVLGIEIAAIDYANKQQTVQTLPGYKGIRLDVYVEDVEGNVYDIEMQTSTVAALGKRCRYYHSEMDSYAIHKGVEYKDLKKSIVIFVCTFDPFKENRSVYTFRNTCQEVPGRILEDDSETIILNTKGIREGLDERLVALLDYMEKSEPTDEYTGEIEKQVKELEQDDDWRKRYMTFKMKLDERFEEGRLEGIEQGIERGIEQGIERGKELMMLKFHDKGYTYEQIADLVDMPLDEVQEAIENAQQTLMV